MKNEKRGESCTKSQIESDLIADISSVSGFGALVCECESSKAKNFFRFEHFIFHKQVTFSI